MQKKMMAMWTQVGALLIAITLSSVVHAQSPVATSQPVNPEELWSRIVRLLQVNGGFTNHEEVEEALGLKFTSVEKDDEKRVPRIGAAYLYKMAEVVPGVGSVRMTLFEDPKKSSLILDWGRLSCVPLDKVLQDIGALGWGAADVRGAHYPSPSDSWNFHLKEAMAESARTGQPLRTYVDTSSLTLSMPDVLSDCVIGIGARIWHS